MTEHPGPVHSLSVVAGMTLYPDDDFTCMEKNDPKETFYAHDGSLYIECSHGHHSLDGQLDDDGFFVGLSLTPWP